MQPPIGTSPTNEPLLTWETLGMMKRANILFTLQKSNIDNQIKNLTQRLREERPAPPTINNFLNVLQRFYVNKDLTSRLFKVLLKEKLIPREKALACIKKQPFLVSNDNSSPKHVRLSELLPPDGKIPKHETHRKVLLNHLCKEFAEEEEYYHWISKLIEAGVDLDSFTFSTKIPFVEKKTPLEFFLENPKGQINKVMTQVNPAFFEKYRDQPPYGKSNLIAALANARIRNHVLSTFPNFQSLDDIVLQALAQYLNHDVLIIQSDGEGSEETAAQLIDFRTFLIKFSSEQKQSLSRLLDSQTRQWIFDETPLETVEWRCLETLWIEDGTQ